MKELHECLTLASTYFLFDMARRFYRTGNFDAVKISNEEIICVLSAAWLSAKAFAAWGLIP